MFLIFSHHSKRSTDASVLMVDIYNADKDDFFHGLVTMDKCWVHFYAPKTKTQSKYEGKDGTLCGESSCSPYFETAAGKTHWLPSSWPHYQLFIYYQSRYQKLQEKLSAKDMGCCSEVLVFSEKTTGLSSSWLHRSCAAVLM